jgi:hypothetical protein
MIDMSISPSLPPLPELSRLVRVEEAQLLPIPAEFLPHFRFIPRRVSLFLVEPFGAGGLSLSVLGDRIAEDLVPRLPPVEIRREDREIWNQLDFGASFRSAAQTLLDIASAPLGPDLRLALPPELALREGADYLLELGWRRGEYPRLLVRLHTATPA